MRRNLTPTPAQSTLSLKFLSSPTVLPAISSRLDITFQLGYNTTYYGTHTPPTSHPPFGVQTLVSCVHIRQTNVLSVFVVIASYVPGFGQVFSRSWTLAVTTSGEKKITFRFAKKKKVMEIQFSCVTLIYAALAIGAICLLVNRHLYKYKKYNLCILQILLVAVAVRAAHDGALLPAVAFKEG